MSDTEKIEPFGGFSVGHRTFSITATDLGIARSWSRADLPDEEENFDLQIGGKAVSKDAVCIIGETEKNHDFSFHLNSNDPAEDWKSIGSMERALFDADDESTPERKLKKYIFERCDEDPPTATLFWYDSDWETGVDSAWVVECTIPSEIRDQLVKDIFAGLADEITVGIKWVAGLVYDKHVPPSLPTHWGLFKTDESDGPESLQGHVESFTWKLTPPTTKSDIT